MKILAVIPARGGSKGLPGKNIKLLQGKPLICYSIDIARQIVESDLDICVSTDDRLIIKAVADYGLHIPFVRPNILATDDATTNDMLIHALNHYIEMGKHYDAILLLQPTSPLRTLSQVKDAINLYNDNLDMVVSVKESHSASVICNEDENGYVHPILNKNSDPRQKNKKYFEYNGAIYVINPKSLLEKGISNFNKRIKYIMPEIDSYDIDTKTDWIIVETILKNRK